MAEEGLQEHVVPRSACTCRQLGFPIEGRLGLYLTSEAQGKEILLAIVTESLLIVVTESLFRA